MDTSDYEQIVNAWYAPVYRFAYSLSRTATDAADLTQEAFRRLAANRCALRDPAKAKTWLFTTAYRVFLQSRRHQKQFPEVELEETEVGLPTYTPEFEARLDSASALAALLRLNEAFRLPLTLFYLEQHSYQEIADILQIPIGTVMSRIARGKKMLRDELLMEGRQKIIRL